MADLCLVRVSKAYGKSQAVRDLSLAVAKGEFLTLLGPSGCGKTTTLRLIAGFEMPDTGVIAIEGSDITHLPPHKRNVNTVFQNYALFPHLDVFENVAFGLRLSGTKEPELGRRVHQALERMRLDVPVHRRPHELSGGQQQRVALARALVNNPAILLLDEPLGALDLQLRREVQRELKDLQRSVGITFIYVTHDQEEAQVLSDRIAVMAGGTLQQIGTPDEIYRRPTNRFVASFIGRANFFDGKVEEIAGNRATVNVPALGHILAVASESSPVGASATICVRPEKMRVTRVCEKVADSNVVKGQLKDVSRVGSDLQLLIQLENGQIVQVDRRAAVDEVPAAIGETIFIGWVAMDGLLFTNKSDALR